MSEDNERPPVEDMPEDAAPEKAPVIAWVSHVVPFIAWLFVMQMLGDPAGWKYAVRSLICLALFLCLRPWRWYPRLQLRHMPLALGVGVAVFLVWIAGETDFAARWPALQQAYLRIGTLWPWEMPDPPPETSVYAPGVCGWPFTIVRILGSAFVIAFIEEFFWRGFLYRWLLGGSFIKVDLGKLDWPLFLGVAVLFGVEHQRWLVGVAAGLAYGWMALRTRDIWAVGIAHAVTNLLLGLYVVWAEKYAFWG